MTCSRLKNATNSLCSGFFVRILKSHFFSLMCLESFLFMWEIVGTRFWQNDVKLFPMGYSTETYVEMIGMWAWCNHHREHFELVYSFVKIKVVLMKNGGQKWIIYKDCIAFNWVNYINLSNESLWILISCIFLMFYPFTHVHFDHID